MAEKTSSGGERFIRTYRNVNAAIGAGALVLAGIVPSPELQAGLLVFGAIQLAQAGLAEVVLRAKKGRLKARPV